MRNLFFSAFILLVLAVATLHAHEGEEHSAKGVEQTEAGKEEKRDDEQQKHIPSVSSEDTGEASTNEAGSAPYRNSSLREAVFEHVHNKVVHFPIALAVGATLLFLLAFRWQGMEAGARVLVLIGALSTIIAYFTGRVQRGPFEFEGSPVGIHQALGIITTLSFWVWVLFSYWRPLRKFAWLWALVVTALVMTTGFYGGLLSHG